MNGVGGIGDLVSRLPKTQAALAYAGEQHADQRRTVDGAPFIVHPQEVATLLYHAGADDVVIAAGVLHDTIEKTSADARELRARFGAEVTAIVLAVSEDERIGGYAARKAALCKQVVAAGPDALLVFAADKLSKVRELQLERTPHAQLEASRARKRRLAHYRGCLALLEDLLPDSALVRQLRLEVDSVAAPVPMARLRRPVPAPVAASAKPRHA